MTAASHWTFVLWAYALVALVVGALIAWVILTGRRRQQELQTLEARGVKRRSADDAGAHSGATS